MQRTPAATPVPMTRACQRSTAEMHCATICSLQSRSLCWADKEASEAELLGQSFPWFAAHTPCLAAFLAALRGRASQSAAQRRRPRPLHHCTNPRGAPSSDPTPSSSCQGSLEDPRGSGTVGAESRPLGMATLQEPGTSSGCGTSASTAQSKVRATERKASANCSQGEVCKDTGTRTEHHFQEELFRKL